MDPNGAVEPIAVVGIGLRLPQNINDAENLWDTLVAGKSALSEVPANRFNIGAFYHPDADRGGTTNAWGGYYLEEDMAEFDAPFFSITPNEAKAMDPMQRKLLEVVYEATENAGITLSTLAGSDTSCYIGYFTTDYEQMGVRDPELFEKHNFTGTGPSILSNRISYYFDLRGPSVTINTACSSGLVGVHFACQSLRSRESRMAIVGGAAAMFSPDIQCSATKLHFLSPDCICWSFDERANGYARGEGMAAVVLKPLSDAIGDGDCIRAVIRGSAVNSDGGIKPGITSPKQQMQESVIKAAYAQARCDPSVTAYVEAHGTGTKKGDPTESRAISTALQSFKRSEDTPKLYVGSIKPNIGHLEGASGLAGLIKAILSVERGVIFPTARFRAAHKNIDLDKLGLQVPTEVTPWPVSGTRRVSVNSFAYGGTNAHVIIDDAVSCTVPRGLNQPKVEAPLDLDLHGHVRVFYLSGHEEGLVRQMAERYADFVANYKTTHEQAFLDHLALVLLERRSKFRFGFPVAATTRNELIKKLRDRKALVLKKRSSTPRLGFIFTGQGAQWWGMGRELMKRPVFAGSIDRCNEAIAKLSPWSLRDELLASEDESRINSAEFSQPLCTALQIGLVDLCYSWGIVPKVVIGHSMGEIAAAYATGALSAENAMIIAYQRGQISAIAKSKGYEGAMLAVGISEQGATEELLSLDSSDQKRVTIACVNSPKSVTISGDSKVISQLQESFSSKKHFARRLMVDTAWHSFHMENVADHYRAALVGVEAEGWTSRNGIAMMSSMTGKLITAEDNLGADYWVKNLTSCVRFADALMATCKARTRENNSAMVDILIEIGPHSMLHSPIRQTLTALSAKLDLSVECKSVLVRERDAEITAVELAGHLFAQGYPVGMNAVQEFDKKTADSPMIPDLPRYCWNHSNKYWSESRLSRDYRFRPFPRTDVIGAPSHDWNPLEPRWRNFIRLHEQPWLNSHRIQGVPVYPGSGFCCMALEAAAQLHHILSKQKAALYSPSEYKIRDLNIQRALVIPDTAEGVEISFSMRPKSTTDITSPPGAWYEFRVFSYTDVDGWTQHCRGLVNWKHTHDSGTVNLDAAPLLCSEDSQRLHSKAGKECKTTVASADIVEALDDAGLNYGREFQCISNAILGPGHAKGKISVTDTLSSMPQKFEFEHLVHPATIDGVFQMGIIASSDGNIRNIRQPFVPTFIKELTVNSAGRLKVGDSLDVAAHACSQGLRETEVELGASHAALAVCVHGLRLVRLGASDTDTAAGSVPQHGAQVRWAPEVDLLDKDRLRNAISETFASGHDIVSKYVDLLAHKNPEQDLLEIGAQSGELTAVVLETLQGYETGLRPRFNSYTCTNSSDSFVELEEKFAKWRNEITFKTLDVGTHPDGREITDQQFDIIVAANPFDAFSDVEKTFNHFLTMLLNGGKLILLQNRNSAPQHWMDSLMTHKSVKVDVSITTKGKNPEEVMIFTATSKEPERVRDMTYLRAIILYPTETSSYIRTIAEYVTTAFQGLGLEVVSSSLERLHKQRLESALVINLTELEHVFLANISATELKAIQTITQECAGLVWLSSSGTLGGSAQPKLSLFQGLARSIRSEQESFPCVSLDFSVPTNRLLPQMVLYHIMSIYLSVIKSRGKPYIKDREFAERDGVLYIKRVVEKPAISDYINTRATGSLIKATPADPSKDTRALRAKLGTVGDFESIFFDEDISITEQLAFNYIEIAVHAVGLNMRDAHVIKGEIPDDCLGYECSGIVTRVGSAVTHLSVGDPVIALSLGCLATRVQVPSTQVCRIPANTSLTVAAALPVAYTTVYYGLVQLASLQKNDLVLIHDVGSIEGRAALQIAQNLKCNVFASVNDASDIVPVAEKFGIDTDRILCCLDQGFCRRIMDATRGRAVDVIVNTTSGEAMRVLWDCIAPNGRFLQISNSEGEDSRSSTPTSFPRNMSYFCIDILSLLRHDPSAAPICSRAVEFCEIIFSQHILPIHPRSVSMTGRCLRQLYSGKQKSKFVVEFGASDSVSIVPKAPAKTQFSNSASYLIAGGFGGIGLSVARWMAKRGAKTFIFLSRSGPSSVDARKLLADFKEAGIQAVSLQCNIANAEKLSKGIENLLATLPPLRGVIQSAMVLSDSLFSNMSHESYTSAIHAKVQGSWALHQITQNQPLDFFIMLSGAAAAYGNAGSSNYVAGCAFQAALATHRRYLGLPGTTIDLGRIAEVGLLTTEAGALAERNLERLGLLQIYEKELLALVELSMIPAENEMISTDGYLLTGVHSTNEGAENMPFWGRNPVFCQMEFVRRISLERKASGSKVLTRPLTELLKTAQSLEEAAYHVLTALLQKLSRNLRMALENIDPSRSISTYGIDSLSAAEIRNFFVREAQADLTILDILQASSLESLAKKVALARIRS